MNDNDNIKGLIGARLEEIHLSETMTATMPSDEEILRWETLAQARRAQKQRNKRCLLSLAAVFLLAVVISVAVIVSPPDAEAGGDGRAVMVGNEDGGISILDYQSFDKIPQKLLSKFLFIKEKSFSFEVKTIRYTETKNAEQLEIVYTSALYGDLGITEIIAKDNTILQNDFHTFDKKEIWGDDVVYIAENPNNMNENTFLCVRNDRVVMIYVEKNAKEIRNKLKEGF